MASDLYHGEIKHFSAQKGYGHIMSPDFDGDVYFKRQELPEELIYENLKGYPCTFEPVMTQDGKTQAKNVQVMGLEGLVKSIGYIKSFAAQSQYGFITCSSVEGDIYFKAKDLLQGWWNQDLRNCKVKFQLLTMNDGKFQAREIEVVEAAGVPTTQMQMPQMGLANGAAPAPRIVAPQPMRAVPVAMAPVVGHTLGEGSQMTGQVKTFDPNKGYGFILAPNFPSDVYFKANDPSEIQKGVEVTFTLKYTPDGKAQALNVCRFIQHGESLTGTVRSYNPNKGFGFLSVDGRSQDVYFQKVALPFELQDSSLEGSQFQFHVNLVTGKPQAQDLQLLTPNKRPFLGGGTTTVSTKRFRFDETGGGPARPSMAPLAMVPVVVPSPRQGPQGSRHRGSVRSFNPQKGFGFIQCPSMGQDVYFNAKNLVAEQFRGMQLDQRQVSFSVRFTPDGKPQANEVQVEG